MVMSKEIDDGVLDQTNVNAPLVGEKPLEAKTNGIQTIELSSDKPLEHKPSDTVTDIPGIGHLLMNRYVIDKRYGKGSFGEVFEATDEKTMGVVAIKVAITQNKSPDLLKESNILKALSGNVGIPLYVCNGVHNGLHFVVMESLGKNLTDCFTSNQRKFSHKTLYLIAEQMITRLEVLHKHNIVHRDLKPDNFVVGRGRNESRIYLIDFGWSKSLLDVNGKHIEYKKTNQLHTGTHYYASIRAHCGGLIGCRDDLESLAYVLVFFVRGGRSWKIVNEADKHNEIYRQKKDLLERPTTANDIPNEIIQLIDYARKLEFDELPDYAFARGIFQKAFIAEGFKRDGAFEWI